MKGRDRWRLRTHYADDSTIVVLVSLGLPFAVIAVLLALIDLTDVAVITILFITVILMFAHWFYLDIRKRSFMSYPFMSLREFPIGFERVTTAINLLLAGRRARFEKVSVAEAIRTRRQLAYQVYDMDGVMMLVIVRTEDDDSKSPLTQVRLLHDMKDEGMRKQVEGVMDHAITSPLDLNPKRFQSVVRPKLNTYKGSTYRKDHGGVA